MGDPKRFTNKFSKPNHPWEKARIEEEKELKRIYGLKNKKELWKMNSVLKTYKSRTKELTKQTGAQAEIEKKQLIDVVKKYGLITEDNMDLILGLEVRAIMDRRLQSLLVKKGLCRTAKQARQMITHEHVLVGGKKITSPSYLVSVEEEGSISFSTKSPFFSEEHPERKIEEKVEKVEKKVEKKDAEILVDPEEAKTDFVKETSEETLVESLSPEEKEVIEEKKEETVTEKIEESIEKSQEVAEGKPAPDDETIEDNEETPGDVPEKAETPSATVKENE